MTPLLNRTDLKDDESLDSFIIRLHWLNYYDSMTMISRLYERDDWSPPSDQLEHLSQLSLVSVDNLRLATTSRFNLPNARHVWGSQAQYCPLCLQDDPYHRLSWSLVAIASCVKHDCLLWRECSHCHATVSVKEVLRNTCDSCENVLSDAPVISVKGQRDLIALLYDGVVWSEFPADANTAYDILFGLARDSRAKTKIAPQEYYERFTVACKAMRDWPHGFYRLLDTFRETGQVQQDFGSLHSVWLERKWRGIDFLQSAFDDYLLNNYHVSPSFLHLRRVRDNPTMLDRLPSVTEAEASRILGVSAETVKKLVENDRLQPIETNSHFNLIDRESVLDRLNKFSEATTLEETSEILGVSKRVIVALVHAGMLEAAKGSDDSAKWLISLPSAYALRKQLRQATTKIPFAGMMRLKLAIQKVSAYEQNTVSIIQRIIDEKMKAFWATLHISDIAVSAEDVDVWLTELREGRELISLYEFAQRIGVKHLHIVETWVDNGLIVGENGYFEKGEVDRFLTQHLWTHQAAQMLAVGVLTVQKWARNGRLHPVSGREVDGLYRYLFRKDEIIRFRPSNRLTSPQMARELGVSRSQLNEWIKVGKVTPVSGIGIDRCKHYLFLRE